MLIVEANYMNLEHVQTNCGATKLTSVIEMSQIKEKLPSANIGMMLGVRFAW